MLFFDVLTFFFSLAFILFQLTNLKWIPCIRSSRIYKYNGRIENTNAKVNIQQKCLLYRNKNLYTFRLKRFWSNRLHSRIERNARKLQYKNEHDLKMRIYVWETRFDCFILDRRWLLAKCQHYHPSRMQPDRTCACLATNDNVSYKHIYTLHTYTHIPTHLSVRYSIERGR